MPLKIDLRSDARSDADAAQIYYARKVSPQTATGFTDELLAALQLLAETPHIGSNRYAHLSRDGHLRLWRLERFPFLLFYRVNGDILEVVRLVHERRRITQGLFQVSKRQE